MMNMSSSMRKNRERTRNLSNKAQTATNVSSLETNIAKTRVFCMEIVEVMKKIQLHKRIVSDTRQRQNMSNTDINALRHCSVLLYLSQICLLFTADNTKRIVTGWDWTWDRWVAKLTFYFHVYGCCWISESNRLVGRASGAKKVILSTVVKIYF